MQNPHSVWRILLVAVAGLAIAIGSGMAPAHFTAAQGANLLQNPGFEGQYTASNGDATRLIAPGWQPWNAPKKASDPGYVLVPQYRPAANQQRVRGGNSAQEWFEFYATYVAGVYQRVPVAAGTQLQFSAWVNVWSTNLDDPNLSEQPGGVRIRVGIDPSGGNDGTSPNIVWTTAPELYDQYQQVTVTSVATASTVSVFIEGAPQQPVKNNDVYVDDASLVATGQVVLPTQTQTAVAAVPSDTPQPVLTDTPAVEATSPFQPTREGTIVAGPTETAVPGATTTGGGPTPAPTNTIQAPANLPGRVVYSVVAGDTLSGLASRYNSDVDAIASANGLNADGLIYVGQQLVIPVPQSTSPTAAAATPTLVSGVSSAPIDTAQLTGPTVNGIGTYIVQPGDDFAHIAAHYGLTVNGLAQMNGIVNPNLVSLGTVLVVPGAGNNVAGGSVPPTVLPTSPAPAAPKTHTVAAGENLFRISLKYGVTLDALMRANGIYNPNLVYVGQVLRIP